MSDRWPGGIISKTPVIPTGPSDTGSAPGIWTMDQASYWIKQGLWPTQILRDPYFPYVTMLLSTTSTNGGQNNTFLDSSSNNFTFTNVNTPTQGSFSPYGSNWSGYFDGSGDYLTVPSSTAFGFGSGDYTVELWAFCDSKPGSNSYDIVDFRTTGTQLAPIIAIRSDADSNAVAVLLNGSWVITGASFTFGQWNHIALTRSGTSTKLFVNGTQTGSTYTDNNTYVSSAPCSIGAYQPSPANTYFQGYISNLRVVKGTAVYTSNFTPPTQPLTAISGTSLLTCAYNRFRDGSTNNFTITRNGDTKTLDFSPFAPASPYSAATNGGSLVFNGSNEATYVDSSNAALTLGTGDFTIELWVYQRVLGGAQSWVSTYGGPGSGYRFSPTNTMQFSWGDSDVLTSTATPDINQWCHVAVTRSGSTVRIFKNGVVVATGTNSTNLTGGSTQTTLGRIPTYNQWYYNGYMSDVRIVKGTAVYTADFTPPTAPLTAISGTSLLARGTNANIYDAAATNDLLTVGNAQSSTAQAKFGTTSMYFDGAGDYLVSNTSSDLYAFGTGDFTVEMWFNSSSFANLQILYDSRPASTDGLYVCLFVPAGGASVNLQVSGATQITGTAALSTGVWYHLALSRSSGSTKMFLNGTQVGSTYADTNAYLNSGTTRPFVGGSAWSPGTLTVNGYIDELRVTKGIARYTSNFTPPTAAFPTA